MSLVIALKVNEGIVLASDQRGIIGDPNGPICTDDAQVKLLTFKGGAVAMTGMVGHIALPLETAVSRIEHEDIDPLDAIRMTLTDYSVRYWPSKADRPDANLIVATARGGVFRTVIMNAERNFVPHIITRACQAIGMTQYVMYLYRQMWRDDLTLDAATRLAAFMIHETSKMDGKVGPNPVIVHITKDAVCAVPEAQIANIIAANNAHVTSFAATFFGNQRAPFSQVGPST